MDAVYVALPVSLHTEWTVKALHAGKLVIFEATSAAIQDRGQPSFGRADAVAQATVLDALRRSGLEAAPVRLDRR